MFNDHVTDKLRVEATEIAVSMNVSELTTLELLIYIWAEYLYWYRADLEASASVFAIGPLANIIARTAIASERAERKPEPEQGWVTGVPVDGIYWWRSQSINSGGICHVAGETIFMTTNTMPTEMPDDIEFSGPVKPPKSRTLSRILNDQSCNPSK
jgi:hypothetical protein